MKIDQHTVAVVTGAASGIGRGLAKRLAREGASLALADVNAPGLEETARMISGSGKVTTHLVDVADRERFEAFVDEVVREHGRANLIINNAGVALAGTTKELSIEDIDWLMGINFWGVIHGAKLFLPILEQQPQAHIVNISSIFGIIGMPGHSAYVASKFAVRGFTEALRHELRMAKSHIRVSVVHPGGIKTNIANSARMGAGADTAKLESERRNFENIARTTPEAAAERIVRGVMNNEDRILIGADAWLLERIQRWMPVRYFRLMQPMLERMTKP
ncbi:MAG: SDR family oxidoreductase [Blastocatellia bacterium]|nr:SDR family oxidoreductase [Blastocatellia bacterium]